MTDFIADLDQKFWFDECELVVARLTGVESKKYPHEHDYHFTGTREFLGAERFIWTCVDIRCLRSIEFFVDTFFTSIIDEDIELPLDSDNELKARNAFHTMPLETDARFKVEIRYEDGSIEHHYCDDENEVNNVGKRVMQSHSTRPMLSLETHDLSLEEH